MKNAIKSIVIIAMLFSVGGVASAQYGGDYYTGGYSDFGGYDTGSSYGGDYYTGGYSDWGGYDDYTYGGDYYTGGYSDWGGYDDYTYGGDYYTGGYSDWGGYDDYTYGGDYYTGGYSDWNSGTGGYSTGYDTWNTGGYDTCSYGGCGSTGGYSTGYSAYQPTQSGYSGCSGSSCGGSRSQPAVSRGGGGFNLGLNYQDNDTTITDNSDRSVTITEDNDWTNIETTNDNRITDSYNNYNSNNRTEVVQRNDDDRDLDVQCIVSDSSVTAGSLVTYQVNVFGGDSPFDIEWRGSVDGDDQEERVRYNSNGTYTASVVVTDDDGNRATDSCTAVIVGSTSGTFVSSGTTYVQPTGQLASLSAVSLSQVPYTGPADVLKVLGTIALVVLWSLGGAYWLRKRRGTKTVSNGIAAFKAANRQAITIK